MTINLYVTSTQNFSGKSAVCASFLHRMQKDGYSVGYLKPFSSAARVMAESSIDEDARFIKETFKLTEPLETIAPVVITSQQMKNILADGGADYRDIVKQAVKTVGQGKDIVVMEGGANFREGYIVNLSPAETADMLDAKVVTVIAYHDSLQVVDDALTAKRRMGQRLIGIIINSVPSNRLGYVHDQVIPYLQKQGVGLLAVLPHQQTLHSITIGEIVDALGGEVLLNGCSLDELVENLTVAAMNVEQALNYFRRVTNKVVIVGGDRPDIQLAALETSTKAMILTGNTRPNPMIAAKAEERGVAVILSQYETLIAVEKVEQVFGKSRFHQFEKVTLFEYLLNNTLDFNELYQVIGLQK